MTDYTLIMLTGSVVTDLYLSEMVKAGYPPKQIIFVSFKKYTTGKKLAIGSKILGRKTAIKLKLKIDRKREYRERLKYDPIIRQILGEDELKLADLKLAPLLKGIRVDYIEIDSFNSKELIQYLQSNVKGSILTAGSGILRKEILSIPNIKFINIHSGLVPYYRGLDNAFWALLYGDTPGCSVFYIDEGIDTGKLIYRKETPFSLEKLRDNEFNFSDIHYTIKICIKSYLKIKTLIEYLDSYKNKSEQLDMMNLPTTTQNLSEGRNFHLLHPKMRNLLIERIINNKQ